MLYEIELERAYDYIERLHGPATANLANALLFRNDWKHGQQFTNLMKAPEMERLFLAPFKDLDSLSVELPFGLLTKSESEAYGGTVLDTAIYADHVFLATAEGLLQSFIDPRDADYSTRLYQHNDVRAQNVTVRYGSINVSAEENGLLFGSMNPKSFEERQFYPTHLRPVASFSRHTSFAERDLLNYSSAPAPELLRANVTERELSPRTQEKYQVTGYRDAAALDSLTHTATITRKKVSSRGLTEKQDGSDLDGDFEVVGNHNNQLLVSWNGRLRVISMTVETSVAGDTPDEILAKPASGYKKNLWEQVDPSDILQTLPIRSGFVVEYPNSLRLITKDGSFSLSDESFAEVRTFATSKQFKDVVAAVEESCLSLTGYYLTEDTLF
ncbi:hypothetical protein [Pseudonocardia sp. TMWB2A]|uniref:hypothetical protein n=1 Tax=Pseudonocardia sp. TMWB2A TaxID=687430 RepID=UPI00307DDC97